MTLEQIKITADVALPLVERAAGILSRLFTDGIDAAQALAELKGLCAVTSDRLSKLEYGFKARDAEHDARVALLTTSDTSGK
jgi:hypothetical protein